MIIINIINDNNNNVYTKLAIDHQSGLSTTWVILREFKDINSTVTKMGSVFIGQCWCNLVQISKGCLNGVIIISLQEVIKRLLKGNIPVI